QHEVWSIEPQNLACQSPVIHDRHPRRPDTARLAIARIASNNMDTTPRRDTAGPFDSPQQSQGCWDEEMISGGDDDLSEVVLLSHSGDERLERHISRVLPRFNARRGHLEAYPPSYERSFH